MLSQHKQHGTLNNNKPHYIFMFVFGFEEERKYRGVQDKKALLSKQPSSPPLVCRRPLGRITKLFTYMTGIYSLKPPIGLTLKTRAINTCWLKTQIDGYCRLMVTCPIDGSSRARPCIPKLSHTQKGDIWKILMDKVLTDTSERSKIYFECILINLLSHVHSMDTIGKLDISATNFV